MLKELLVGALAATTFNAIGATMVIELDTYTDTNGDIVTQETPFLTLTIDEDQTNPIMPGMTMLVVSYEANLAPNQAIQSIEIPFDDISNQVYNVWTTGLVGSGSSGSLTAYSGRDPNYEILLEFDNGSGFFQDGESGQLELYSFEDISMFSITDSFEGLDEGAPRVKATLATFSSSDPSLMVWDDATQTMIYPQEDAAPEPSSALFSLLGTLALMRRKRC